jgi:hypothetical protein
MNAGMRFSHFHSNSKNYYFMEPRISAAVRFINNYALKGSYASMNQYIHMISGTGISLPTDLWVPTTDRVRPQQSRQVALGIVKDIDRPDLSLSVEGYYKTMNNVIGYKEGASFLHLNKPGTGIGVDWEENVTEGRSWSYGIEFLIQKKTGKFSGWIGYTLSWTQMQFDSLNFGKKFWARYDRRHDLSLVGMYRLNNKVFLSGTWVYGTGNAISLPLSEYIAPEFDPGANILEKIPFYEQTIINDFSQKNNFRMKPYHRLDIGIQFHKNKKWGERIWEISVYNAYNRRNPFYYYNDEKYIGKGTEKISQLKQVSLFPVIPSVTYSFRF